MSDELARRRRFFAEEIEAVANLRTPGLVEALAGVPRERFLGPGPWLIRSESDAGTPPRQTPDADPRHVYHNVSVALDAGRQLYNGQPGLVAFLIDALGLRPGARVLHVGCGAGYYSAVIADIVGAGGRVRAVEVGEHLAATARANLVEWPWVNVERGDGTLSAGAADGPWDGVLINAGVTHPLDAWLDALGAAGRLVLPLTATFEAMGPIGKGPVILISKQGPAFAARVVSFLAIYSAIGIRDDAANVALGEALKRTPFPRLSRLRRDLHAPEPGCWLHAGRCCLS